MVQRLGYLAFTEAARVRLPVGEHLFVFLVPRGIDQSKCQAWLSETRRLIIGSRHHRLFPPLT